MDLSKEPISVRSHRISQKIKTQKCGISSNQETAYLSQDGLLDALQVLFDECNSDCLKNSDKKISGFVKKYTKLLREIKQLRANITDFEVINVIGRGHFGDVHIVRERQTGDIYALKTVSKSKTTAFEEERDIMALTKSFWHTSLQYAFQDNANLYFVMEFHPGGDLCGLLSREGGTLPESATCFYIAELVLALNDLHAMGYVHRDVKPDNILLDRCGHLKLADFGSAAKISPEGVLNDHSLIPIGTPEYIAPEVLQVLEGKPSNNSYGIACDYWSVGVLAYEMTVGHTPFIGKSSTEIYAKIMDYKNSVKFPEDIVLSQAFVSLVKGLLTDQNSRLAFKTVICHDLFKNTDFSGLKEQVPPFVPNINSVDDVSNFTDQLNISKKREKELNIENYKLKTKFCGKNLPFIGFTFIQDFKEKQEHALESLISKDAVVLELKNEIEKLQKRLLNKEEETSCKGADELEIKLEEKSRKLEVVESIRNKLEQELVGTITELKALKRTLEFEKHERAKLESKALEMIKSAKEKWELSEKMRNIQWEDEVKKFKDLVEKLSHDKESLERKLEALSKELSRKDCEENIAKLGRRSVLGLESRLKKICDDSQNEQASLKDELKKERQKNEEFSNKLQSLEHQNYDLINKFECVNEKYKELCKKHEDCLAEKDLFKQKFDEEFEVNQKQKSEVKELRKQLNLAMQCEDKLDAKEKEVLSLERLIKDLQKELNQLKDENSNKLVELKSSFEIKIEELKEASAVSLKERNDLELKLKEAELKNHDNQVKVKTLEDLLGRLESGVTKLEHSSEREQVLQEQIDRLENQLAKVHESSALEHQELSELKSKTWRLEKDHANALLDRKIVERDLKDSKAENKKLQQELDNLQTKMKDVQSAHKLAVLELEKLNESLATEIVKLKENVKHLKDQLLSENERSNCEKKKISELENSVLSKEGKIKVLESTVKRLETEKFNLNGKLVEQQSETSLAIQASNSSKEEYKEITKKLQNTQKKLENAELNLSALREACSLQEDQLVEYERIHDKLKNQLKETEKKVEEMLNELTKSKFEHQQTKKALNEEKSLKLKAQACEKRLKEELDAHKKEITVSENRCANFESYSSSLSEQLKYVEEKYGEAEITLKSNERQMDEYLSEINLLKEQNSGQLTRINNLKESTYELNKALLDVKSNNIILNERILELEATLQEKLSYYKEREIKMNATILQQTKLIDYLQCKLEESSNKKKRTLTDKLFGGSSSSKSSKSNGNLNNLNIKALSNYRDLESELAREKEKANELRNEIEKLHSFRLEAKKDLAKNEAITCLLQQQQLQQEVSISSREITTDLDEDTDVFSSRSTLPPATAQENEELIAILMNDGRANVVVDLPNNRRLIGADNGLFVTTNKDKKLLQILGLESVFKISIVKNLQTVLMIVNRERRLISCDLKHLLDLTECAEVTRPTLKYQNVDMSLGEGFNLLQVGNVNKNKNLVVLATNKQLVFGKFDEETRQLRAVKFLDTAKETSCALFTSHSLILGADKFFEVDLASLKGEEFLDDSDVNLKHVFKLQERGSLPKALFKLKSEPLELLCCFNEFGIFVDEYGRSTRNSEIKWNFAPKEFIFTFPYLHIFGENKFEVIKLDLNLNEQDEGSISSRSSTIINKEFLEGLRLVGFNKKGVYYQESGDKRGFVKFLSAFKIDLNGSFVSSSEEGEVESTDSSLARFSFTSSICNILDDVDEEGETDHEQHPKKHVKFQNGQTIM